LENEIVREEQVSGSRLANPKSNTKDKKYRERRELSVNETNIIKDAKCSICKEGYALVKCRKFSGIAELEM